jgi:thioredoxin reductase
MYKNIETINDVDILIIGAGSAGCIAAIAAASAEKVQCFVGRALRLSRWYIYANA